MIREHQNTGHTARLEWIVIILIAVEIVIGIFESVSILGWLGTAVIDMHHLEALDCAGGHDVMDRNSGQH